MIKCLNNIEKVKLFVENKYTLYTHCVCTTVCIMSSQLEKPYHYETRSSDTAFPTDST
jgi:hypothetical protein